MASCFAVCVGSVRLDLCLVVRRKNSLRRVFTVVLVLRRGFGERAVHTTINNIGVVSVLERRHILARHTPQPPKENSNGEVLKRCC